MLSTILLQQIFSRKHSKKTLKQIRHQFGPQYTLSI